jgi:hypothetical protein
MYSEAINERINNTITKEKRTKTMSTNNGLQNTTQKTKDW